MYGAWLCQPWPLEGCCDFVELNIPPTVTGAAHEAASELLWLATGQRFGNCAITLRPCTSSCLDTFPRDTSWWGAIPQVAPTWGYPFPSLLDGQWFNVGCGSCQGECDCTSTSEVIFPDPLTITSIEVDGVELTEGIDWALYSGQRLVRLGSATWPTCQDWTVTGGAGTFLVTASIGEPVPTLGKYAAGKLTCEFAKDCAGLRCELPPAVTSVTRQGVTMTAAADFIKNGMTGLRIVDTFIQSVNPRGLLDRARAYSPDLMPPRLQ